MPGVKVWVIVEGEMKITDGKRESGVYWKLPSRRLGKQRAQIQDRTDCDENFDMIKGWLAECNDKHGSCSAYQSSEPFLPTRLIHIGSTDSSGSLTPRLILSRSLNPSTLYFALSYCWGTDRGKTVQKTTHENLHAHFERIDTHSLSRTYLEAMEVVKKLGYRYIWIDALCIIQDDSSDFEVECSQMHQIYSRAYCTIVASDSYDGDGGCFHARSTDRIKAVTFRATNLRIPYNSTGLMDTIRGRFDDEPGSADVTIYPNFGPWIKSINQGPVFKRGWCLQEREMSPRVIHFTKSRLLWECREGYAAEDTPVMRPKTGDNKELAPHLWSQRLLDDQSTTAMMKTRGGGVFEASKWEKLVEEFSRRKLSVVTDKLPAISGLAATLAQRNPEDTYLAGLWRKNLLKGLSWIPHITPEKASLSQSQDREDDIDASAHLAVRLEALTMSDRSSDGKNPQAWPSEQADSTIPSWSWASFDGPIRFCGDSWYSGFWKSVVREDGQEDWVKSKAEIDIEFASVQHTGQDPFGRVSGGELILRGWVADIEVSEDHYQGLSESRSVFEPKSYSGPRGAAMSLYFDVDVDVLPDIGVVLLQLGTGINPRKSELTADCGLVLFKIEKKRDVYRRVGIFAVSGDKLIWQSIRRKGTVRIV